jgi:hypothetical protein
MSNATRREFLASAAGTAAAVVLGGAVAAVAPVPKLMTTRCYMPQVPRWLWHHIFTSPSPDLVTGPEFQMRMSNFLQAIPQLLFWSDVPMNGIIRKIELTGSSQISWHFTLTVEVPGDVA